MIRSIMARETVSFRRSPITTINKGLQISFQNIFNNKYDETDGIAGGLGQERPHVRVIPSHLEGEVRFAKQVHVKQVMIIIEMNYLKQFLGSDQYKFNYLFESDTTFFIEEFMSPEITALIDNLLDTGTKMPLPDFNYRLKALELLYILFKNLSRRQSMPYQQIGPLDIDAIYRVRNAMAASLNKPLPVEELAKLAGMNELKLRKLFIQIFGMGMYAYLQHLRMHEAAHLLKDKRLSVSETGYQLGFTNISYFGRLFEQHMGMTPKKWTYKWKI